MDIIAVVNEKGGTGKTTSTVNLAAALGEMGKKVLLVDLDGQGASSRWLGVEGDTSFADALLRGKGLEPVRNVAPNVDLAPGHGKLDSVAHDLRPTQGGQLRKLLASVTGYDFVLIDCPPSLGNRLIGNAMLAATHALVPVETSILALDGLKILLTTLEDIRDGFGHDIVLLGVLACRYDKRTRLSRLVLEELQRALPNHLLNTTIRENVRLRECPASGQSILAYADDSNGAEDYRTLAREVVERMAEQPVPDEAEDITTEELIQGVDEFEIVAGELESGDESNAGADRTVLPEIDGKWQALGERFGQVNSASSAENAEPEPDGACEEDSACEADESVAVEPDAAPVAERPAPALAPEPDDAPAPSDLIMTWPAELDVLRAERIESADENELKNWPEKEDVEVAEPVGVAGGESQKKGAWLKIFRGLRH